MSRSLDRRRRYDALMATEDTAAATQDGVYEALEEVIDPELGLDFVSLGLVYDVEIQGRDVYVTFTLPFCILMLRSYFAQIPKDMEEAAMVDGCSRVGAILRTLLPLSYPALIGAGLYTFLLAWNEFLFAVVLIEAWEKRVITMAIYSLMAEFVTDWSMMMAFSVLASAPLVIAFIFLQRYMVRGMTAGAITA